MFIPAEYLYHLYRTSTANKIPVDFLLQHGAPSVKGLLIQICRIYMKVYRQGHCDINMNPVFCGDGDELSVFITENILGD
jgi:hypothetical protein